MPRRLLLNALIWATVFAPGVLLSQGLGTGRIQNANTVNVRSGPGVEHSATGKLRRGESVEVEAVVGKWARVQHGGGEGWVFASFVSMPAVSPETPPPAATPEPSPAIIAEGEVASGEGPEIAGAPDSMSNANAPSVAEQQFPEDVRADIDRILTLTEAVHHDLERQRNTSPIGSPGGSGVSLQAGLGLLALGGLFGFFVGGVLGRQHERQGRPRVRF